MPKPRSGDVRWLAAVCVVVAYFLGTGLPAQQSDASGSDDPNAGQSISQSVEDDLEELANRATGAAALLDVRTPSGNRQGSGFLVDPSGRILTNAHVIRNAESVRVRLASGDVYDHVSILAMDERRDIGVVQIPGFDLPALSLGNSDSVRIGTRVVLVGSPLGLENTVSTGIVSGRRQEPEGFQLLQITAPASQGSSGGAVLSRDGRVVGIAASQMQAGQNLNFAVPINYARGLLANLDGEPIAVLTPTASSAEDGPDRGAPSVPNVVNRSLDFGLSDFRGYGIELRSTVGTDTRRRSRVTYRLIQTVGGGPARIERYFESETTVRTEPFDTRQTVERSRSRTIVRAEDLRPMAATGEASYWTGETWKTAEYDLRFADGRVRGLIADTVGQPVELDRELPRGILLRPMTDLAFAMLEADSLVGRSVELEVFDPRTGEVVTDRYDVRRRTSVEVGGEAYPSYEVVVASGLSNATTYFRIERPRMILQRERRELSGTESTGAVSVEFFEETSGE